MRPAHPDCQLTCWTLPQVADVLGTVAIVRKLIRIQCDEDADAAAQGRPPQAIGLRACKISARITRVTETALSEYLSR
jgi:hypothetical protein